jgi:hypothetical protein
MYTLDYLIKNCSLEQVENYYYEGRISQDLFEEYSKLWHSSCYRYSDHLSEK